MFSKKGCFLSFEWEKTNFTTFGPLWKKFGKSASGSPGRNPSDAHGRHILFGLVPAEMKVGVKFLENFQAKFEPSSQGPN